MDANDVGMGKAREELAGNSLARNMDIEKKDCDTPLKLEGHSSLPPPVMCPYNRGNFSDYLSNSYRDPREAKNLCSVTSLVGSGPPGTSSSSMNDTGLVVEELTARDSGSSLTPVLRPISSRQGQWQHLYQLASGSRSNHPPKASVSQDKDQMAGGVREESSRMPSGKQSLNPLLSKQIYQNREETSIPLRESDHGKVVLSNKAPVGGTRLKQLSTSSFSQIFAKNVIKGKGVVSRSQEPFSGKLLGQNYDKVGCVIEAASDALLKSNANSEKHSVHGVDRPGHLVSLPTPSGICLREHLQPGRKVNKVESLSLFKQIVELVDLSHSQGIPLLDFRPSHFILLPSNTVKYTGPLAKSEQENVTCQNVNEKRPLEQYVKSYHPSGAKQQKLSEEMRYVRKQPQFTSSSGFRSEEADEIDGLTSGLQDSGCDRYQVQNNSRCQSTSAIARQQLTNVTPQLEKKWYTSPEELNGKGCTCSSNIYGLGVLLFELLSCFKSWEVYHTAMLDLRHRILPPHFLSENQVEAGLCLWLLHPEPSSRPTTRKIIQSELLSSYQPQELCSEDETSASIDDDAAESELLLHFLVSMKEEKHKHAFKVMEDIECLEKDIKEVERRHLPGKTLNFSWTSNDSPDARDQLSHLEDPKSFGALSGSCSLSSISEKRLMKNISQFENAYFSMRSQTLLTETAAAERSDKNVLKDRDKWSQVQNENDKLSMNQKPVDHLGAFSEGLCKFARYSKFEVRGLLRNGDLLNSANVICSLSFDRDEEYIAAAGVSKKIKVFEFSTLSNESIDIHYPVVEMSNSSKLSCVCWNNYIKNYLASTDYHGVVQMWDASTGQGFSHYTEHQKRTWSVDFSLTDPTMLASGSDDCSVKLWSINEKDSLCTIPNPANVCCVQFSTYSTHLLASGSADYKISCYDLRNTKIPWCTLVGHEKAVSYVKFLDSETLVSASTDNTIKIWDLNKTSSVGLSSNACVLTLRGHSNEKNFVGLSAIDGYIACGSETNEVYSYYRSLPMPIISHKFGSIDPISGQEIADDNGQFVSSVCWRKKSSMLVAANSSGSIKLLQMV